MRTPLLLLAVAIGIGDPLGVSAQTRATTADLVGIIRDATDAVLPGITVTATNVETNQSRTTVTEADGRYAIPALPPGIYSCDRLAVGIRRPEAGERDPDARLAGRAGLHAAARRHDRSGHGRRATRRSSTRRRPRSRRVVSQQQIEQPADRRPELHLVRRHHARRDHRSDAAAGRLGDVGADVRRPARAIEQHHRRRPRQQRRRRSAACAPRSARRPCASSRCSPTRTRPSSATPPAAC